MKSINLLFLIITCLLLTSCKESSPVEHSDEPLGYTSVGTPAQSLTEFENVLDRVRNDLKIPGFSAAIAKDGEIVWAKGFGFANRETGREATPETVYHLASLTKPFTTTVIMQLVEENVLDLESPISDYGVNLESDGIIRIKHLLSHTSEGVPGSTYNYNGNRFSSLDNIVLAETGKTFCELLNERIITPLNLNRTGPYPLSPNNCLTNNPNNSLILAQLAQGYTPNGQNQLNYPTYFGTAAGLVSNAIDVTKFSIALDNDLLLSSTTKELMFTPTISNNGSELPYGLGWFIDNNEDVKIIWHYGYWDAISSLIIKIPERNLTFVILANTDRLSSASQGIGIDENVNRSVVAQEFLNAFVYGTAQLPDEPIY